MSDNVYYTATSEYTAHVHIVTVNDFSPIIHTQYPKYPPYDKVCMATVHDIQLHIIDSAVAKRLLQRRSLHTYTLDVMPTYTEHTMYFDTAQRSVAATNHALALIIGNKGAQRLLLHAVADNQITVIGAYHLLERTWPQAVHDMLDMHRIPAHQLLPNAHYIVKSSSRRILDAHANELAVITLHQGVISANHTSETWDTLHLTFADTTSPQESAYIVEYVAQHVPHRIDMRTHWQRIDELLRQPASTIDESDLLTQQAIILMGMQRSTDESLLIPLPHHDSFINRRMVATLMCMHHQVNTDLEPFWLASDDETRTRLRAILPPTMKPSYTALTPPIDITQIPFGEVLRLRIRSRLRSLLERESEVLSGFSAYDVHRIRVILRKMRALLECGDGIYEAEDLTQFKRGFRRMTRFLGEIRDCDAFGEHVRRILDITQLPQPFEKGLMRIRQNALKNFKELLTHDKHQLFLQQFAEFATMPQSGSTLHIQSVPVVLTQRIAQHRKRLAQPHPKSLIKMNDDALHDLRIEVKHLRYLLECFADVLLPAGEVALQRLIDVQDHLGTIQDAVVAQQLLQQMHLLNTPDGKRIIQTLRQEAHQLRLTLPDMWARCNDEDFETSITHALAHLQS